MLGQRRMRGPDELRSLFEAHLETLTFSPELGALRVAMAYSLTGGGKRIRPVVCLATAEAAGGAAERALDAAVAVELVHTFSLVHDDLPALDDDDERRGRPSTHIAHGEDVALLAGDGLLGEAFRFALRYDRTEIAEELAAATVGMIGGQYLDVTGTAEDVAALHALKTGRLFVASVTTALWAVDVPVERQAPWRRFAEHLGPLFQAIDDILDGDGSVVTDGAEGARALADAAALGAREALDTIPVDTSVLAELVDGLLVRAV